MFHLDASEDASEAKKSENPYKAALWQSVRLALAWNRADVLSEEIFRQVVDLKDVKIHLCTVTFQLS
jgi:hypothetical protein